MSKRKRSFGLPLFPKTLKFSKFALGVILVGFFLNYYPTFTFPPEFKQSKAQAQNQPEQNQTITAESLPFSFQLPHPGYLSTPYSTYHPGIDIATGLGMPIHPVAKGTVIEANYSFWGYGLNVVIDHGSGYRSLYGHLGQIYVKVGQQVEPSDYLGTVGLTGRTSGPHTHLEVLKDGSYLDPKPLLPELRYMPKPEDFIAIGSSASSSATIKYSPTPEKSPQNKIPSTPVIQAPTISTPSTNVKPISLQLEGTHLKIVN